MTGERRNKKTANNNNQTIGEKTREQAGYPEVNKQVKTSIRTDKCEYAEYLAMTAAKAGQEGHMRLLYDTTTKLAGVCHSPERPLKSKKGEVITSIEEQRSRGVEHLKEVLDRSDQLNTHNIQEPPTELSINVGHQQSKRSAWPSDSATRQNSIRGTENEHSMHQSNHN
ncbi:unnamed protein product [Schistosoma mattheei]|uniref:Uncharacterized protein n=1 Tax=Schistosoma mattheei TaxID=31246 RepID=A0A183P5X2_9TREM|nr:unnamed protein product [Schistosoma mattheei]